MRIYLMKESADKQSYYLEEITDSIDQIEKMYHKDEVNIVIDANYNKYRKYYAICEKISSKNQKINANTILRLSFNSQGIEHYRKIKRQYPKTLTMMDDIETEDELEFSKILGVDFICVNSNKVIDLNKW